MATSLAPGDSPGANGVCVVAAIIAMWISSANLLSAETHGERFLDNGAVRLGVDLSRGGCISYFSPSGRDENVVNNFDLGRQIQMSFYSGPVPFTVGEKKPQPHWAHIGWNPIQTGDDYKHGSKILEFRLDEAKHELYVRCIPMQWPLDNVPAECEFESWVRLEGATAHVRGRIVNHRTDKTQYPARHQELPAVYVNGPYYRHVSYQGPKPYTGDALTHFDVTNGKGFPWRHTTMTENWAALLNEQDWGLGVWHPGCFEFSGGFAGKTGNGGTKDGPTGYIAPVQTEIIDHDIDYDYRYVLILGTLTEIRDYVTTHADKKPRVPDYRFDKDRRHWRYADAYDYGWPTRGELDITFDGHDPHLMGPLDFWQAADAPKIFITAAFRQKQTHARVFWQRLGEAGFSEPNAVNFPVVPDGTMRTYEIDLSQHPNYQGAIIALRLDPTEDPAEGEGIRLKSITGTRAK